MLKDYLKIENVQIVEELKDWQSAVEFAVRPLISQGYVSDDYIKGIIDNTYYYGAYYVITDHIALLHARPEQGVISTQVAVTLVNQPVYFLENKRPANILITLAAANDLDHLEALQTLGMIFESEEKIHQLLACDNPQQLYQLIIDAA